MKNLSNSETLATLQDVEDCYFSLLRRAPDAPGLEFWQSVLKKGITRKHLMDSFVKSTEFQAKYTTTNNYSGLQFYPGYKPEDANILRKHVIQKAIIGEDYYIDGFGQKTLFQSVPFCKQFNKDLLSFPVPDDGYHAEALEYIAVCESVSEATANEYCIAELGAGWGPWVCLGGVLARNQQIPKIILIGVEADTERFSLMKQQFIANNFLDSAGKAVQNFECTLIQGAAWSENTTLYFANAGVTDMAASTSTTNAAGDYLGRNLPKVAVQAYSIQDIIKNNFVNLLHIDIQGAEFDVIASSLEILKKQVKAMLIGTHSRVIEGKLIDLLYRNGWYLHREKPCQVNWQMKETLSTEAMTTSDGIQYWKNNSL
jgi:FkbM family methyltransferase